MIEIRNLTKRYGGTTAIDNLNFSVRKGEVVGFLGPNGAGKSTTMKIITGFMAPTSGEVKVAGVDVFEDPIAVKRRIGFLPETPPLYTDMVVRDYLEFVARLKGVSSSQIRGFVDGALEKTGLTKTHKRLINNLSKGFKQRVGIAQALVSHPEILILDEPTVGLDPQQVAETRKLIQELRGHHTIILSTHILPEVQATCERIIIIYQGKIVAEDTLEGLNRRMTGGRRIFLRATKTDDNLVASIRSVVGVRNVELISGGLQVDTDERESVASEVASRVIQAGAGLLEMRNVNLSLEDIFLRLTTRETGVQEVVQ